MASLQAISNCPRPCVTGARRTPGRGGAAAGGAVGGGARAHAGVRVVPGRKGLKDALLPVGRGRVVRASAGGEEKEKPPGGDEGDAISDDWLETDAYFFGKLALISFGGAAVVKYGSLLFDFPFEGNLTVALLIIFLPTLLNVAKWANRSAGNDDFQA